MKGASSISHHGSRMTRRLIGREDELGKIRQAISDQGNSHFIYITGDGGIGKTRLLRYIVDHFSLEFPQIVIASNVIDFYHSQMHSLVGFIGALLALFPELEDFVKEQWRASFENEELENNTHILEDLARAEQEGLAKEEVLSRSQKLADWIAAYIREHRIVLIFDTAERLVIESDPARKFWEIESERALLFDWLLQEFFPKVNNVVILWAGRPNTEQEHFLQAHLRSFGYQKLVLRGLTRAQVDEYIADVILVNRNSGNENIAEKIEALLSPEIQEILFESLRDNGALLRPILLSLAIDHVIETSTTIPSLPASLVEARYLTDDERKNVCAKMQKDLISAIMNSVEPADEIIRLLGLLRKGANAELLAFLTGKQQQEIDELLCRIQELTFIKVPSSDRYFLHDEMYDLFRRYALDESEPVEKGFLGQLIDYYAQEAQKDRELLTKLYEQKELPSPSLVAEAYAKLEEDLVEEIYYRLRYNRDEGYQTYFAYAQEAAISANYSLDMFLYAELLMFLKEQHIQNGFYTMTIADIAVRVVKRLVTERRVDVAVSLAKKLRETNFCGNDIWAKSDLASWEAVAQVYSGELEAAENLLFQAFNDLQSLDPKTPREKAVLARVFNNLGYVKRIQGQYYGAIEEYKRAYVLWKEIDIEGEIANTLNNMAFAKAEVGYFGTARRQAEDALIRRQGLGPRLSVGLSLNTLAHIALRDNDSYEAQRYAEEAYQIFERLGSKHEKALSLLVWAETLRRSEETKGNQDLLEKALEKATAAMEILEITQAVDRKSEAFIELGCVYRDLAKVMRGPSPTPESITEAVKELEKNSESALRKAVILVQDKPQFNYLFVRAYMNLAWLYYYVLEDDQARETIQYTRKHIPLSYHITPLGEDDFGVSSGGLPRISRGKAIVPYLVELGKAELLLGQICFNAYKHSQEEKDLRETLEHYALCLAYNTLLSEQSTRDGRRAMDRIYQNIKGLNKRDLLSIVGEFITKYGLGDRTRIKRFIEEDL